MAFWDTPFLPNGHKDAVECIDSCGTKFLAQLCSNSISFRSFAAVRF